MELMEALELLKILPNNSIDVVITDPPYDLYNYQKEEIHAELIRVTKGAIIIFSPPENQWVGIPEQIGFWIKPISTKNTIRKYSRFVEMIFFYQTSYSTWNSGRHWSQYTNVFTDIVDDTKLHPFRKPPSLITRLLLNHSNENNIILDPFMGSGIVKDLTLFYNRKFIGCDINPIYDDEKYHNL